MFIITVDFFHYISNKSNKVWNDYFRLWLVLIKENALFAITKVSSSSKWCKTLKTYLAQSPVKAIKSLQFLVNGAWAFYVEIKRSILWLVFDRFQRRSTCIMCSIVPIINLGRCFNAVYIACTIILAVVPPFEIFIDC